MATYTVAPGDHMVRVAVRNKLRAYRPIWDANGPLQTACGNPNTLLAGKEVTLADPTQKSVTVSTEQRHRFIVDDVDHLDLFVVLKDENDKPIPDMLCDCPVDQNKLSADGDGKLQALDIDIELDLGILKFTYKTIDLSTRGVDPDPAAPPPPTPVNPDPDPHPPPDPNAVPIFPAGDFKVMRNFALGVGYLDPLTEVTGIQARLNNLGYYAGDVGYAAEDPQALQLAIEEFELDHKSTVTGDKTNKGMQAKLKTEHGC